MDGWTNSFSVHSPHPDENGYKFVWLYNSVISRTIKALNRHLVHDVILLSENLWPRYLQLSFTSLGRVFFFRRQIHGQTVDFMSLLSLFKSYSQTCRINPGRMIQSVLSMEIFGGIWIAADMIKVMSIKGCLLLAVLMMYVFSPQGSGRITTMMDNNSKSADHLCP